MPYLSAIHYEEVLCQVYAPYAPFTRNSPLRKPNRGEWIVTESPGRIVFVICLIQCIVSLLYVGLCCPPALRDIFHIPVARCSLFVLEVPLNNNKPNQTKPKPYT